jgi:hypothetical protein
MINSACSVLRHVASLGLRGKHANCAWRSVEECRVIGAAAARRVRWPVPKYSPSKGKSGRIRNSPRPPISSIRKHRVGCSNDTLIAPGVAPQRTSYTRQERPSQSCLRRSEVCVEFCATSFSILSVVRVALDRPPRKQSIFSGEPLRQIRQRWTPVDSPPTVGQVGTMPGDRSVTGTANHGLMGLSLSLSAILTRDANESALILRMM